MARLCRRSSLSLLKDTDPILNISMHSARKSPKTMNGKLNKEKVLKTRNSNKLKLKVWLNVFMT